MITLDSIVGSIEDAEFARRLHRLEHADKVERIILKSADFGRRRLLSVTDRGSQCAISLPRSERLFDGAILMCSDERAIVVRAETERWLTFTPRDTAAALELGYFAGNMHWTVRFDGSNLSIAAGADAKNVTARLQHMIDKGAIMPEEAQ